MKNEIDIEVIRGMIKDKIDDTDRDTAPEGYLEGLFSALVVIDDHLISKLKGDNK